MGSSDELVFNPPPGWPTPPAGWRPPDGWQPDSSWPPAPAGWHFLVPKQRLPQEAHGSPASQVARSTPEFRFPVLVSRALAILALGSAALWLYAASEGFSSEYVFCPAACADAPGWAGDTLLWLVPLVLVLLLAVPKFAARAVTGGRGSVAMFWALCLVGWGVAAGIAFAAANDTGLLAPDCEATVTNVDTHLNNEEVEAAARLIMANTGCFVQEDVDSARQFLAE